MFGWVVAAREAVAEGDGIGTPGRPVQYSTPVFCGEPPRGTAGASRGAGGGGDTGEGDGATGGSGMASGAAGLAAATASSVARSTIGSGDGALGGGASATGTSRVAACSATEGADAAAGGTRRSSRPEGAGGVLSATGRRPLSCSRRSTGSGAGWPFGSAGRDSSAARPRAATTEDR